MFQHKNSVHLRVLNSRSCRSLELHCLAVWCKQQELISTKADVCLHITYFLYLSCEILESFSPPQFSEHLCGLFLALVFISSGKYRWSSPGSISLALTETKISGLWTCSLHVSIQNCVISHVPVCLRALPERVPRGIWVLWPAEPSPPFSPFPSQITEKLKLP